MRNPLRFVLLPLLAVAALPVAGCKTSSSGLSTAALSADFTIHETVDATTAKAEFHAPGGAFVELATTDHISCNGVELQKVGVGNAVWYAGVCGGLLPAGLSYKFELRRELQNNQTTTALVPAMEQFAVTSPARDSTVKITEQVIVLWSNQGGKEKMSVTLEGDCMEKFEDSGLEDNGKAIIPLDKLKPKGGSATCDGTLTVTRFRNGNALITQFASAKSESYYDDVTKLKIATR
ncbi:MAG: hypothetical protein JWM74_4602 [Myxococcaceae bacterium]|nr:hypothetical protein [Myxococcaceae bacterium]